MAPRGPNPTPIEVKRRRGTLRADRTPNLATMVEVAPLDSAVVAPLASFATVIEAARPWLADTDAIAVAMLRETMEEREGLRSLVLESGDRYQRKALRDIDRQLTSMLAALGFDPSARARFGLAEVKAATTLEKLRRSR